MANICTVGIKVVGKTEQSVNELIQVFGHKHPKFYLYRSDLIRASEIDREGEFFTAEIDVDVASRAANLLPPFVTEYRYGNEGSIPKDHPAHNAVCTDLPSVCKALDVGVEIFSEEPGCCFQEHIVIDHKGNVVEDESEEWHDAYEDEDGNEVEETGGFDFFGEYDDAKNIYYSEMEDEED